MLTAATVFLIVLGVVMALAFALPLLVAPLRWAKVLRWKLPAETHLAIYLGRCTGGLAVAIIALAFRAAADPMGHRDVFELLILAGGMMTLVHVVGALRREQPLSETLEIGMYFVLTLALSGFYYALFGVTS